MNPECNADSIFARALSDEVSEDEVRQFSNKQLPASLFAQKYYPTIFAGHLLIQADGKMCGITLKKIFH